MPPVKSYAEDVRSTCGICGVAMQMSVRLVVDCAAYPDLENLARQGALRLATCPDGHTAPIDLPLLLRRPACEPALVFYPAAAARPADEQLRNLIDLIELGDLGLADAAAAFAGCCVIPGELKWQAVQPYESYLKLVGSTPRFAARFARAHAMRERMRQQPSLETAGAAVSAWHDIVDDEGFDRSPVWMQRGARSELAFAFSTRFAARSDPQDADMAIAQFAIAVDFPADHRFYRAFLRYNYAMALAQRFDRQRRRADLETAISVLQRALPDLSGPTADLAASLLASTTGALHGLYGVTQGSRDLTGTIEARVDAAKTDAQRMTALASLALAVAANAAADDGHHGIADILDRLEAAVRSVSDRGHDWARSAETLARLAQDRYDKLGIRTDLDRAIAWRQDVADRLDGAADRGFADLLLNNLAYSLRARYAIHGGLADLEAASRNVRRALGLVPEGQTATPGLLNQWAGIAHDFYRRDKSAAWLQEAVRVFRGGLTLASTDDPVRSSMGISLGLCLNERFVLTRNRADLDEAIAVLRDVLSRPIPSPLQRSDALFNLGTALLARWREADGDEQDRGEAVAALTSARSCVSRRGIDGIRIAAALAGARADIHEAGAPEADSEAIGDDLRKACEMARAAPEIRLNVARRWLERSIRLRRWREGCEAAMAGMDAIAALTDAQVDRHGRASWLADAQRLSAEAAYVRARDNDLAGAIDALERGRAQLLASSLLTVEFDLQRLREAGHAALAETYLSARQTVARRDGAERMVEDLAFAAQDADRPNRSARGFIGPDPTGSAGRLVDAFASIRESERGDLAACIAAIRRIPGFAAFLQPRPADRDADMTQALVEDRVVLVYFVVTAAGSLVLFRSANGLEALWLDDASYEDVRRRVFDQGGLYDIQQDRAREKGLSDHLSWLGRQFVEPMVRCLSRKTAAPGGLVLIPTAPLTTSPLHAAMVDGPWRAEFAAAVAYAPSAAIWLHCRNQLRRIECDAPRLALVANPQPMPEDWSSLYGAEREAAAIQALIPGRVRALTREAATPDAVLTSFEDASHLHIACHGQFDERRPDRSSLLLSQGKPLQLLQCLFANSRLEGLRLVVMSACQSGLSDLVKLPEESVGLVSVFVEAGAPGVIGSVWPVDDDATALLMTRFYAILFADPGHRVHPAAALQQAQVWLRDLDVETLRGLHAPTALSPDRETVEQRFARAFAHGHLERCIADVHGRAFAHPYYWAAFRYHGA